MDLTRISGGTCGTGEDDEPPCGSGDCPTVYTTDRGTLIVQGYTVHDHPAPDGETLVEIPAAVLIEAARALAR